MPPLIEQIQTTPELTNFRAVFAGDPATNLTIPETFVVDVPEMEDLHAAFYGCPNLQTITLPAGFGRSARTMEGCFSHCTAVQTIAFPEGCGTKVYSLNYCFEYCRSLTDIAFPAGFGAAVQNMYATFSSCNKLKSIVFPERFGTKLLNFHGGFSDCSALESVTFPAGFGSLCNTFGNCFRGCTSLTTINGGIEAKVPLDLSPCTKLTHDSIMVVINSLQTVTTTQKLTLGATNLAKLTDEEKKVATDKGWTLA